MLLTIVEHEEIVFSMIKEYLYPKRPFDMSKILPYLYNYFSRASININQVGIKKIIISLLKKKKIVEGSTLTSDEILNNTIRKRIYDLINENPGIIFHRIKTELDLSNAVGAWHLSILERFEYIRTLVFDNHEIYLNPDINLEKIEIYYLISSFKRKKPKVN